MFKYPRTSQPQQPVGIDWGNPLTAGLCAACLPNGGQVLTLSRHNAERFATRFGTGHSIAPASSGLAAKLTANTTSAWRLNSTANETNTAFEKPSSAVTLVVFLKRLGDNSTGNAPIFGNQSPSASPYSAWALVDRGGADNISFELGTGAGVQVMDTGVA